MLNFIENIMSSFFYSGADQYSQAHLVQNKHRLQTNKTSSPVAFQFIISLNAISC